MATDFRFDPEQKLVLTCYWGEVGAADIAAVRHARENVPRLAGAVAHVVDATGVTNLLLTTPETRDLASEVPVSSDATTRLPTAIIATSDIVFGMGRMFGLHVEVLRDVEQVRLFRTWEEAAGWLRLDLAHARALADQVRAGAGLGLDDLEGTRGLS